MKVIFSHVKYPFSPSKSWVKLGAVSNYHAKQHGFETIFFGDEESLNEFKNVEYDHFEKISNNEINQFPKCLWNMGKLITLKKVKEPCIHLDMDIFLRDCFDKKKLNKDILCLHDEIFSNKNMKTLQALFRNYKPIQANGEDIISYNCGIMGGNDYTTMHNSLDILFDHVIQNYHFIDAVNSKFSKKEIYKNVFYPPVLVEQVWLFQIFKGHFGKEISKVVSEIPSGWADVSNLLVENCIVHLMSNKKDIHIQHVINRKAKELNLKF
jgi:hypothetical protein